MVVVKSFRTTWGVEPSSGCENYKTWLPDLKKQGYCWFFFFLFSLDLIHHPTPRISSSVNLLTHYTWSRNKSSHHRQPNLFQTTLQGKRSGNQYPVSEIEIGTLLDRENYLRMIPQHGKLDWMNHVTRGTDSWNRTRALYDHRVPTCRHE